MNELTGVDADYEKMIWLSVAVYALDFGELCSNRWCGEVNGHLPEVVQLPLVCCDALNFSVVQTDGDRSAFGVCEGDDRWCEVARFQQHALSVEPLVLRRGQEQVTDLASGRCERCLNLVDSHRTTQNFFK